MDEQEAQAVEALVTAVLTFQGAESRFGPDDLTALQAKDRLFQLANSMIVQRETDVEPGPVLTLLDGGRKPDDGGIEGP
jgi:hypothetical protein